MARHGGYQLGMLSGLAIAGALAWLHVGPYRWLAELQLRAMGAYYPVLTWIVLGLLLGIPLGATLATMGVRPAFLERTDDSMRRYLWLVTTRAGQLVFAGLALVVLGTFGIVRAYTVGEQLPVSVLALERGEPLPGAYVTIVDGTPDPSLAIEADHRTYVPVFGASGVASVVLEIRGTRDPRGHGGRASEGGLPNLARVAFEDAGLLADPYYVVELGWDPDRDAESLRWLVGLGAVLFGIGLTIRLLTRA